MIKRTISIFLDRTQVSQLDRFRSKYDSLYSKIPPHITLVFPFESHLSTEECINHLKSLIGEYHSFHVTLEKIKLAEDGCLYVLINEGKTELEAMHDALYKGILSTYKSKDHNYEPHVTIGRFSDHEKAKAAQHKAVQHIDPIKLIVQEVTIETIADDEHSNIEYVFQLKSNESFSHMKRTY